MQNKYYFIAFNAIHCIKASEKQTGEIKIKVEKQNIEITNLGISKTSDKDKILSSTECYIQKKLPLYFKDDYFISEFKIDNAPVIINDGKNIKIEEGKTAEIVLSKKLKLKEIKFKDSNFKQHLNNNPTYEIKKIIKENKDLTYKTIFDNIKKILNLFKKDKFGIKLNNLEDTNETPYNGTDKLNEGEEITVILDENKIKEDAFSKFVFEYDEDIFNIETLNRELNRKFKVGLTINEVFVNYLFKKKGDGSNQKVEFDVFKNEDNTPIKCNSTAEITKDLKYFRVKLTKDIVNDDSIKNDFKVILSKKGCKIFNDDILKSIEKTLNKEYDLKLDYFKKSIFIDEKIDKTMISIKNQDTSDTKTYSIDDPELPSRVIIYLTPEAFNVAINLIFSLEDVQKDGRKLKTEFKNNIEKNFKFIYGDAQKNLFINQLTKFIPGITEADIKLNGKPLPEEIKEGGVISIPADKIPDSEFEPKSKPKDNQGGNNGTGSSGTDSDNKKGEEKNKTYCDCGKNK